MLITAKRSKALGRDWSQHKTPRRTMSSGCFWFSRTGFIKVQDLGTTARQTTTPWTTHWRAVGLSPLALHPLVGFEYLRCAEPQPTRGDVGAQTMALSLVESRGLFRQTAVVKQRIQNIRLANRDVVRAIAHRL